MLIYYKTRVTCETVLSVSFNLRLKGIYLLVIVTAAGTVGYGWALETEAVRLTVLWH